MLVAKPATPHVHSRPVLGASCCREKLHEKGTVFNQGGIKKSPRKALKRISFYQKVGMQARAAGPLWAGQLAPAPSTGDQRDLTPNQAPYVLKKHVKIFSDN